MLVLQEKANEVYRGNDLGYAVALECFYDDVMANLPNVRILLDAGAIDKFVICVHGLKSAARIVGAEEFAEASYEMEMAGKRKDEGYIRSHLDAYLDAGESLIEFLPGYIKELHMNTGMDVQTFGGPDEISKDSEEKCRSLTVKDFMVLLQACQDLDMVLIESELQRLLQQKIKQGCREYVTELSVLAKNFEYDRMVENIKNRFNL